MIAIVPALSASPLRPPLLFPAYQLALAPSAPSSPGGVLPAFVFRQEARRGLLSAHMAGWLAGWIY